MTIIEQFLTMTFVASRIGKDDQGNLVRIETRKCERTGLKLTRKSMIPVSKEYMAAVAAE